MQSLPNGATTPSTTEGQSALEFVLSLQHAFEQKLPSIQDELQTFSWLRDEGKHGGGLRRATSLGPHYDRASINVSSVHYDDDPARSLQSATALSTIIHPKNPLAPSLHCHISLTHMKDGRFYWRLMADLNPSNPVKEHEVRFRSAVRPCCAHLVEYAEAQGDRYFFIPALHRHRGVAHYYLEAYHTDDFEKDLEFARRFGEAVIDVYSGILEDSIHLEYGEAHLAKQLEYHTTYFFQVLTLDRGTTSGVLVHDQNDVGIMASLPSHVDKELLKSWAEHVPPIQKPLLEGLIRALPNLHPAPVDDRTRAELAKVVRAHYTTHPEALKFQASGDVTPPTVQNHKPK